MSLQVLVYDRTNALDEGREHSAMRLQRHIPSIGPIRAILLIALMQTPHRFWPWSSWSHYEKGRNGLIAIDSAERNHPPKGNLKPRTLGKTRGRGALDGLRRRKNADSRLRKGAPPGPWVWSSAAFYVKGVPGLVRIDPVPWRCATYQEDPPLKPKGGAPETASRRFGVGHPPTRTRACARLSAGQRAEMGNSRSLRRSFAADERTGWDESRVVLRGEAAWGFSVSLCWARSAGLGLGLACFSGNSRFRERLSRGLYEHKLISPDPDPAPAQGTTKLRGEHGRQTAGTFLDSWPIRRCARRVI